METFQEFAKKKTNQNESSRAKLESNVKQDIKMKASHIIDDFHHYIDGTRVLFLMHRKKEGLKETNNHTHVKKVITRGSEEFQYELEKLLDEKERSNIPYRIYSAVNSRDVEKAIRQFKFEQLNADYYDDDSRHSFYYDLENRFMGALMAPAARNTSLFLFDVDNEEGRDVMGETLEQLAELNIDILKQYKTKNGWHVVTPAFNPNLFTVENVSINKDGLLLLAW